MICEQTGCHHLEIILILFLIRFISNDDAALGYQVATATANLGAVSPPLHGLFVTTPTSRLGGLTATTASPRRCAACAASLRRCDACAASPRHGDVTSVNAANHHCTRRCRIDKCYCCICWIHFCSCLFDLFG